MIAQDFARVRVLGAFRPLARRQQREGAPLAREETEA